MHLADIEAAEEALTQAEADWDGWDAQQRHQFLSTMAHLLGHHDFLRATFAHVRVMRAQLDDLPYEAVADTSETEALWAESLAALMSDPGECQRTSEDVEELERALSFRPESPLAERLQREWILGVL